MSGEERMNGELDALAARLEAMADAPPPLETRKLLYRIDERSGEALHAVGQLAREVSGVKHALQDMRVELRRKADKRSVGEMREKVDSVSTEIDEARKDADITKTTQIKELQKKLDEMARAELKAAQDLAKERRQFQRKIILVVITAVVVAASGAVAREIFAPKTPAAHQAP